MSQKRSVLKMLSTATLLFLILFAIFSYLNKQPSNTQSFNTQVHLTPNQFISLFDSVNSRQAKQYVDKAIEIQGMLKKVTLRGEKYTLFISSNEEGRFIQCEMQDDQIQKIKKIAPNEIVTIKGIFKGVLLDAILLNCILIDEFYE